MLPYILPEAVEFEFIYSIRQKDKIKLKLFSISPQLYICIMGLYENG